jgi:hypothetical protein
LQVNDVLQTDFFTRFCLICMALHALRVSAIQHKYKKKVALALGGAMFWRLRTQCRAVSAADSLFGWLVADGWC